MKAKDFTGKRFGRLVVISPGEKHLTPRGAFTLTLICKCDCGTIFTVEKGSVVHGRTKSCGCYQKENAAIKAYKHGMAFSRQERIFTGMRKRCNNQNAQNYDIYGGRGIIVEWPDLESFWNDMKDTYYEGATIERIDVNGNYSKANCKWVNLPDQNKNKRNTIYLKWGGEKIRFAQLCGFLLYQHSNLLGSLKKRDFLKTNEMGERYISEDGVEFIKNVLIPKRGPRSYGEMY